METGQYRDLIRIYTLIVGAFSIVFFCRWVIIGYLAIGAAGALICSAALFVFLIIGGLMLYGGLERFDSIFNTFQSPPAYYRAQPYYYPQYPYYPPPYGPYYPPAYYPPPGYYPPPRYSGTQPAYPYPPYHQYGYYPPAPMAPRPIAPPPAPGQSPDDVGNRRPLRLPSATLLLMVFLGALIVGGASLALASATGYLSLIAFPFTFIIGFSFPSLIWISYVYGFEQKEPLPSKSILVAFTWGMLSTIPALIVNTAAASLLGADSPDAGLVATLLTAAVVAPLIEELSKPWGVLLVKDRVRSRLDGLIFGVTCGVGFACIENITYEVSFVLTGENAAAVWTLGSLARGLGSIMVHATGAGLIGYAYGRYRLLKGPAFAGIPMAYALAVTLHASWNGISTILAEIPLGDVASIAFIPVFAIATFFLLKYFLDRGTASELQPGGYLAGAP